MRYQSQRSGARLQYWLLARRAPTSLVAASLACDVVGGAIVWAAGSRALFPTLLKALGFTVLTALALWFVANDHGLLALAFGYAPAAMVVKWIAAQAPVR